MRAEMQTRNDAKEGKFASFLLCISPRMYSSTMALSLNRWKDKRNKGKGQY